ncbi:hypothetical protein KJK34_01795 [Flavobacterium sp. D11R37]|uniref:GldM family protein n=1 Tax=Flavobacterium coralii TaxID=2838017 RepID=UPI001CA769EC|nr:GldM family protein [Flavobacterium coralii]MBY8961475.1 hypothetical protein [Flavobacterium coralii]
MKKILILLLLLSLYTFAQTDNNISVISSERTSILFRGIENPIKIAVPGAISFTASAHGLIKQDSIGNYNFNVTGISGDTATITIKAIMPENKTLTETKTFEVRDIKGPIGLINGQNCYNCIVLMTKEELRNAIITISFNDFVRDKEDIKETINSFEVYFPKDKGFIVQGNTMDETAIDHINRLKIGNIVKISGISYRFPGSENYRLRDVYPITIQIVKEP